MPFEPLRTDEQYTGPKEKRSGMDEMMLFGCTGFVLCSVTVYVLSVWPFFLFAEIDRLATLLLALGSGLGPALLAGILATRKFALPGACGFVGGALVGAVFLYLRLEQVFTAALARQIPTPDYPPLLVALVPLGWIVAALVAAIAALPAEVKEDA
jgi:hypothetical protein